MRRSLNCFLKASLDDIGFVVRRFKAGEEVLDASVVYILDFGPGAVLGTLRLFLSASVARQTRRRSTRVAATATTAREQKTRSQERPQAPEDLHRCYRAIGTRATAARKLQAPPGEPWRATPRGQRARASSTPTARGPSRGGRGACLPGGEAWVGMMSR